MVKLMYIIFDLILLFTPWVVWWKAVDRTRLFEILTFGLLLSTIVVLFDTIGVHNHLWVYNVKLFPIIPHFVPMDYSVLPVGYMLTYQYITSWWKYIIAAVILSALGAFIIEPLFIHFGIYEQINWRHLYSFITYLMIALILKFALELLKKFFILDDS